MLNLNTVAVSIVALDKPALIITFMVSNQAAPALFSSNKPKYL